MQGQVYRRIYFLLFACACAIILLQGFWIRNFYNQVQAQFESSVYAALEVAAQKLQQREQIRTIRQKNTVLISPDSQFKIATFDSVSEIHVLGKSSMPPLFKEMVVINQEKNGTTHTYSYNTSFSKTNLFSGYQYKGFEIRGDSLAAISSRSLIDQLIREVTIIDSDEKNLDTLKSILSRALAVKGINTPFEFSIRKITGGKAEKLIAQTPGFNPNHTSFRTDLSASRMIRNNRFLFVQFPEKNKVLLAGMKSNLILSLVFLSILLSVFLFTTRQIMRQKKLNDMRNDFMNNMTHELKTPIATISLAIDAMRNPAIRNNSEKYEEYTSILKEENRRIHNHVDRVLQMARLEKKELPLRHEIVDLSSLVKEVADSFVLQAHSKNILLVTDVGAGDYLCSGDVQHLRSAIANLVDNAVKYSPSSTSVLISLHHTNKNIQIAVKDQGNGIPKTEQDKIFDKFYRVPQHNRHDVKGFGLGLSYVKQIIEQHGGSIALTSAEGQGSTFTITLSPYA